MVSHNISGLYIKLNPCVSVTSAIILSLSTDTKSFNASSKMNLNSDKWVNKTWIVENFILEKKYRYNST